MTFLLRFDPVGFLPPFADQGPSEASHFKDAVAVQVPSRREFHERLPEEIQEMHSR
jgi:hypothetical protein